MVAIDGFGRISVGNGSPAARDVLLVGQENEVRTLIRDGLRDASLTVDTAQAAEDALALLRQTGYRILLLDLTSETQAYEILHALGAQPAIHPAAVLALPSEHQEAAARAALSLGAADVLTPPFEVSDVVQRTRLWHRLVKPMAPKRSRSRGLQLHTLGRFCVELNGQVLLSEGGRARKACTLFKFLLTQQGRRVPSSTVHDLLWPHVPESMAATNLRSMLYQLRCLLKVPGEGSWSLEHAGTTLHFSLGQNDWWDVTDFSTWLAIAARLQHAAATRQAIVAYTAALSLYAGAYLESDPLDDWIQPMRSLLSENRRQALEGLAGCYGALGDGVEQERILRLALSADPYREHTYRAVMALLASQGRSAEALVLYRDLRHMLRLEFDSGPDPQTQALALQIRQPV